MVSANNTANTTDLSTSKAVLISIFVAIVMLTTVIGNSLVIFCVCYYRRLRGRTNYLIVSLAVADWLIGTLSLPFRLIQTMNYGRWPEDLNKTGCQFWIWIDMLCSAASILSLMMISIDRLIAIVDPLKYESRMRQFHVGFMIGITWLFAVICASLSFVKWKGAKVIVTKPECSIKSKEYITFVSTAAFFVPLVVVLVNYGLIFKVAIRHAKRLNKEHRSLAVNYQTEDTTDANHNDDNADSMPSSPSIEGRRGFLKRFARSQPKKPVGTAKLSLVKQLKATKTLAVVVGVFTVCWLPFFIIFVTFQYCRECFRPPYLNKKDVNVLTMIFVKILPVVNSAANPIIYTCFNTEFRRAFKKILSKVMNIKTPLHNTTTSFTAVATTFHKESGSQEITDRM